MSRNTLPSLLDDLDTPPPTTVQQAALCILLRPRLEQLADDVWALAQKSPALAADPALVALAAALLADLCRMLRDEPGVHLLPQGFPPGIGLHALALGLRAMQRALAIYIARRRPFAGGEAKSDFEALSGMLYELMRDTVERIARNRGVTLSPEWLRARPEAEDEDEDDAEPAPAAPEPAPPGPGAATRRSATRRRARAAADPAPAGKPQPNQPLAQSYPRHLSWL